MNVDQMVQGVNDALTSRRVYGDPIERDGVLVIPAAKVRGGGGGGGDNQQNGGGGFGLSASPAGAYVVKGGDVSWVPAIDVNRIVIGAQVAGIVLFLVIRSIFKTLGARR
ncbi:MAG: spore germination protein GerW family protein [Candidatus Limnocylindria bacterium]|nr:sporulation protein [Chloroflexota bacterium]PZR64001.1 MAG: sporulation protein [Chloroflexota bacterium]